MKEITLTEQAAEWLKQFLEAEDKETMSNFSKKMIENILEELELSE